MFKPVSGVTLYYIMIKLRLIFTVLINIIVWQLREIWHFSCALGVGLFFLYVFIKFVFLLFLFLLRFTVNDDDGASLLLVL